MKTKTTCEVMEEEIEDLSPLLNQSYWDVKQPYLRKSIIRIVQAALEESCIGAGKVYQVETTNDPNLVHLVLTERAEKINQIIKSLEE